MQFITKPLGMIWIILKSGKTIILFTFLVLSLIFNVAQFTGNVLSKALEAAIKSTTGLTSVASKATKNVARLTSKVSQLESSKAVLTKSIRSSTKRLSARATMRGARVLAAGSSQAAGSWIPYLGTVTGAAFITYEAYDLCQSFKELHELEELIGINKTDDDYVFCGYDFSDVSEPKVSGLNTKSFKGEEFKKVWFKVPESIKAKHQSLLDSSENLESEFFFFIEENEDLKQTRTWLIDLDYGLDDFYVSQWKAVE
jgi:hypothetical protein